MTHIRTTICIAALLGLASVSAATPQAPAVEQVQEPKTANEPAVRTSYRLGPDDQIMIQVADIPDIGGKPQRIDPNGDVKLPMVGRVRAAGLTLEQLEAELIKRFKVYINEPDIAVAVIEFHSQPVSIIGAVATSGVRQLEGRKTLIEVLSLAGGVSDDAGPVVRITRRQDEGPIPIAGATQDPSGQFSMAEIELKSLLEATAPEKNIFIRPHDVISVPRAQMVFVIGEVSKPGPLPLTGDNSVSVLEAVSASGGVLRTAATSSARILRRVEGGQKRTEVAVNLKQIMLGQSNDLQLMAGDILIVPVNGSKRAAIRAVDVAIQAGILIGTYSLTR